MRCSFVTHSNQKVRCARCGLTIKTPYFNEPEMVHADCINNENETPRKSRGLGDTIAKFTKATGIKAAVDAVSKLTKKPCGCKNRQKRLNQLVPYKIPR